MMCSLQYRGCFFNLILLLSNIVLALMSVDIPVNRRHFTSETTSNTRTPRKTSFNKVVANPVKESRVQKGLADHDDGASGAVNTHLDVRGETQQAHDVIMRSDRRRCDVMTSHRR